MNTPTTLMSKLADVLAKRKEYTVEGMLNKNKVAQDARAYSPELMNLLLADADLKERFFTEVETGVLVFKKDIFLQFITNKQFLPDSYTKYKIKIGLGAEDGTLLAENQNVVLNFPHKDCVLEGGQDKEDQKRNEVFFNEVLAPDQITRLLDDKAFTNWKRYDKDGEKPLDELRDDDNLIIKGNNLVVLHSLEKRYAGKVKLIYIDPPYNTETDSFQYNDKFNHSTWLVFMKNRLQQARKLLSADGAIYVQCDDNEQAYLTILMDEVFGRDNRINTICVNMSTPSGNKIKHTIDGKRFPKTKEYILLYAKQKGNLFISVPKVHKKEWDKEYNKIIPNWTFEKQEMLASSDYDTVVKLIDGLTLESLTDYAKNNNIDLTDEWKWQNAYRIFAVEQNESLRQIANKIEFHGDIGCVKSSQGLVKIISTAYNRESSRARIELVSAEVNGQMFLSDNWTDMAIGGGISFEGSVTLQGGKKPERLLQRIIESVTRPKDIVMDYHVGTGTTCAVAMKLGRRFIGIEQLDYGDNDSTVRLQNVINGDQSGISKSVGWQGGGSFVYCNLMNTVNKYRDRVKFAKDDAELMKLLDEASKSSFLSYRVDPTELHPEEFRRLSKADKQRALLELIDNNTLYMNYEDINDPSFNVSKEDKEFNKKLYEKES